MWPESFRGQGEGLGTISRPRGVWAPRGKCCGMGNFWETAQWVVCPVWASGLPYSSRRELGRALPKPAACGKVRPVAASN